MKYQKELNLSVGLCRHSLATNVSGLGVSGGNLREKFQLSDTVSKSQFLFVNL